MSRPLQEADALLDSIESRLTTARAALEAGHLGALEGLEADVALLGEQVAALPADRARQLRPRLIGVIDEVDRLSGDFRTGLDRLAKDLGETGRRRQAVSAYSQSQQTKPGGR
ncbi:MAG: hypothetical protein WD341_12140 [Tistlia sp.]|uniref:hypothetical protein n=1 Tax=Tistlia sp. TaxID=3057121 RepID=UPI0034A1B538